MKVLILRGIQGSGKTHFNTFLEQTLPDTIDVSADHYFEQPDGSYRFDISKLGEAHASCMNAFIRLLQLDADKIIVVDNTNVTAWEVSPYVLVAAAFKADCTIYTIYCDAKTAAARNQHGVEEGMVLRKHDQLAAEKLPMMWRQYIDQDAVMDWLRG